MRQLSALKTHQPVRCHNSFCEQNDLGSNMPKPHQNCHTIPLINDHLVGSSDREALTKVCIPRYETRGYTLCFETSYLFPEHGFTYAFITISHWSVKYPPYLNKLGTITVPMICSQEPKLEILSEAAAATLLGVDACSKKAVKYTIIGIPRLHINKQKTNVLQGSVRLILNKIVRIIDGNSEVKIELLHPIYEETNDPSADYAVQTLKKCTEGWHRDASKPLSNYFAKSSSKRIVSTAPNDKGTPNMSQFPAVAVLDSKKQHDFTEAIVKQRNDEDHSRQRDKLHEFDVPARLFSRPTILAPKEQGTVGVLHADQHILRGRRH